jgi:hypothetical protein
MNIAFSATNKIAAIVLFGIIGTRPGVFSARERWSTCMISAVFLFRNGFFVDTIRNLENRVDVHVCARMAGQLFASSTVEMMFSSYPAGNPVTVCGSAKW